jgi:hypothetical protein
MFIRTPLSSLGHCELCSLDINEDVLCRSCREMISRLARITASALEPQTSGKAATTAPATRRVAKEMEFVPTVLP